MNQIMSSYLQALMDVRVIEVKTKLSLNAAIAHGTSDISDFVRLSARLEIAGRIVSFPCYLADRSLEKRVLKTINANRSILRTKTNRLAMDRIVIDVRDASAQALSTVSLDESKLHKRIVQTLKRRKEDAIRMARLAAEEELETAFKGAASHLTLDEVVEIWKICNAEMVMES